MKCMELSINTICLKNNVTMTENCNKNDFNLYFKIDNDVLFGIKYV